MRIVDTNFADAKNIPFFSLMNNIFFVEINIEFKYNALFLKRGRINPAGAV